MMHQKDANDDDDDEMEDQKARRAEASFVPGTDALPSMQMIDNPPFSMKAKREEDQDQDEDASDEGNETNDEVHFHDHHRYNISTRLNAVTSMAQAWLDDKAAADCFHSEGEIM